MAKDILDHSTLDDQQRRSSRFDKLSIRDLSGEKKGDIAKVIINDIETGLEYRSQMGLSAIIAALGLLINATPVVIGAMLIAPIMRPIQGVSFATTSGNRRLFFKSIWVLILSILLGVAVSILLTWFIPLTEITNEIAIRTEPTLVDLGIAFSSGLVAFLAFGWKKMAAGLAGVAMAASLVPPLSVIGIGIGFGSRHIARGSTILFMTNLIAIIIAGIGIFYLFGFHPTQKDDLKRSLINTSSAIIMMIVIAVPLASSLFRISENVLTQNTIDTTVESFFTTIDKSITVESTHFKNNSEGKVISVTAKIPQSLVDKMGEEKQEELTKNLAKLLHDDVQLNMILVPFTTISEEQAKRISLAKQTKQKTKEFLKNFYHEDAYLLEFTYSKSPKKIIIANFYADNGEFSKAQFKKQYLSFMKRTFPSLQKVIINRQTEYNEEIPPTEQQERIKNITNNFESFFPETNLLKLTVDYFPSKAKNKKSTMIISLWLNTPLQNEQLKTNISSWKTQIQELYPETNIQVKSYVGYLKALKEE